jgi:hypothetical protein
VYSGSTGSTVTSSSITGCRATYGGAVYYNSGTVSFCRMPGNDDNGPAVYGSGTDATKNWWGSNDNPSSHTGGGATYDPWLMLGISATPSSVATGVTSTISANLTYDSNGHITSGSTVPGILAGFMTTSGALSPEYSATNAGAANTAFTPSGTGTATITATVDSQSVTVPVTVTAGTSAIATSIVLDPLTTPATIYAGVDGKGIYKSLDSGTSWTGATIQPTNPHIKVLVIQPADHTTLFAATYGGGIYTSTDSGATWTACSNIDLTNLNVLSLVSDSSGKLYAGTETGVFTSSDCDTWTAINGGLP